MHLELKGLKGDYKLPKKLKSGRVTFNQSSSAYRSRSAQASAVKDEKNDVGKEL